MLLFILNYSNPMYVAKKKFLQIEDTFIPYFYTILFFVGFLVYGNSLFNGFVWDDIGQITTNPLIHNLTNIFAFFTGGTFYSGGANTLAGLYFKPLELTAFALNYAVWGQLAFGYHLFSVTIHTINVCLIFLLFTKLLQYTHTKYPKSISFLAALLFLVHPANVEAVGYISAIQDPLYVFFLLLSLHTTVSWCIDTRRGAKLLLIQFYIFCSLLSKESGILSVFIICTFLFFFSKGKFRQFIVTVIPTILLYIFLRFGVAHIGFSQLAVASPMVQASLVQRLLTIPYILFSYLRIMLFPKDLVISQYAVITSIFDPRFYLYLPIILIIFLALLYVGYSVKSKLYFFFLLWIFCSFFLLLNIFPLDFTLGERWLYGPLIGIIGLLSVIISRITFRKPLLITSLVLYILIIGLFGIRTIVRNIDWHDNTTLFTHDIQINSTSFEIQGDMGTLENNPAKAKKYYEKAIQLNPSWYAIYANLGGIYEQEKNYAKAKSFYTTAIQKENDYQAYENFATLEYKMQNLPVALSITKTGLSYYPNNPTLNLIAALSYYKLKDTSSALLYAQKAYNIDPTDQMFSALQNIINKQSIDGLLK